jgi:hypothetical protein
MCSTTSLGKTLENNLKRKHIYLLYKIKMHFKKLNKDAVQKFCKDERVKPEWRTENIKQLKKFAYFPAFAGHLSDTLDKNFNVAFPCLKQSQKVVVNCTPLSTPQEKKHHGFEYFFDVDSYENTLQNFLEAQGKAREEYRQENKIEVKKFNLFD